MYQFKWHDMVSDQFVESICKAIGVTTSEYSKDVKKLLVLLVEVAGGLPLVDDTLSEKDCEKIVAGLIEDALREAFSKDIRPHETKGIVVESTNSFFIENELVLEDIVFINWCSEDELVPLPEIGAILAKKIIDERHKNGAFLGGKNLAERISGLGEKGVRKILHRLRFLPYPTLVPSPNNLNSLLKLLVARTGALPKKGFLRILEHTISYLQSRKKIRFYAHQRYKEEQVYPMHECSVIGILNGSEYYNWLATAIDTTNSTIEMAMFHAAMPTKEHPTKALLDKLIAAKRRGVEVRVLLDCDRDDDPYKSTIINTTALNKLKAGGVDARFDLEDKLLHSKFLVLDSTYAVVGSHNWSAGSYFHFGDSSIVINSQGFAQELRQRFYALWADTE